METKVWLSLTMKEGMLSSFFLWPPSMMVGSWSGLRNDCTLSVIPLFCSGLMVLGWMMVAP
uniref:Uncharacterized protein n=1 Tax=uncultured bacterium Rlip1 TaxID=581114 RepID=C0K060_9BACT|nr:unknown [uncultured bacterium Rlip1]